MGGAPVAMAVNVAVPPCSTVCGTGFRTNTGRTNKKTNAFELIAVPLVSVAATE